MKSYRITNKSTGLMWNVSDEAKGADKVIARAKGDMDTYIIEEVKVEVVKVKKGGKAKKEGFDDNIPPV